MRFKRFCAALLLLLLVGWGRAEARISVAPAIIEAVSVQAGRSFRVSCRNQGQEEVEIELSLALFARNSPGGVLLLEDELSKARAEAFLDLEPRRFSLRPGEVQTIQVQVAAADFHQLQAALLVRAIEPGVSARLAVLLLLSTEEDGTCLGREALVPRSEFRPEPPGEAS